MRSLGKSTIALILQFIAIDHLPRITSNYCSSVVVISSLIIVNIGRTAVKVGTLDPVMRYLNDATHVGLTSLDQWQFVIRLIINGIHVYTWFLWVNLIRVFSASDRSSSYSVSLPWPILWPVTYLYLIRSHVFRFTNNNRCEVNTCSYWYYITTLHSLYDQLFECWMLFIIFTVWSIYLQISFKEPLSTHTSN